jgi:hypothetical protein
MRASPTPQVLAGEPLIEDDTRTPTKTRYGEEISEGRAVLQNLRVANANAADSLHSGKLQ